MILAELVKVGPGKLMVGDGPSRPESNNVTFPLLVQNGSSTPVC